MLDAPLRVRIALLHKHYPTNTDLNALAAEGWRVITLTPINHFSQPHIRDTGFRVLFEREHERQMENAEYDAFFQIFD